MALKKLSIHCTFWVYLNRALHDRFVCGLNYEKIQNRLLYTADLTFKLACETARAMEMAEKQAKEFVLGSAVYKVDKQQPWKRQGDTRGNAQGNTQGKTQGNAQSKARKRCRHCSRVKHQPSDCRWQDAMYYKCQQRGHIIPACKTTVPYKDKKGKTHVLEDEVQEDSSQGYPTISGSTNNMFSMTAVESDCVRERCQPGDGSQLRCNILRDREKPAVHVRFTVSAPAVGGEVADLHW